MSNGTKALIFGAVTLAVTIRAFAMEPSAEYRRRVESSQNLTALTDSLFGDSLSLFNGKTTFSVTDIDVPGNSTLPVQLTRYFDVEISPAGAFTWNPILGGAGGWTVDVPYVTGMFAPVSGWASNRCSGTPIPTVSSGFNVHEIWQGNTIHIPGEAERSILMAEAQTPVPNDGIVHRLTSNARDIVDCIPMQSGLAGEGFLVRTQTGLSYYFDIAVSRAAGTMTRAFPGQQAHRARIFLLASRVADRFGNSVSYQYNAPGNPTSITANDGRQIILNYANGNLTSASSNGRSWTFGYTSVEGQTHLASVTRPDGSAWQYTYSNTLQPADQTWDGSSNASCSIRPPVLPAAFTLTAVHPSGAVGVFSFSHQRHFRSGVHMSECAQRVSGDQYYYVLATPNYYDVMSLDSKSISGAGLPAQTWTYSYPRTTYALWGTRASAAAYPCATCPTEKVVSKTNPDGTTEQYRYGVTYALNEGRLLGSSLTDVNGVVRRVESTTYLSSDEATALGIASRYGIVVGGTDPSAAAVRPVVSSTTVQDGTTYRRTVDKGCTSATTYCLDAFGRTLREVKSSAPAP